MKNPFAILKEIKELQVQIHNPATDEGRVEIIKNLYKRGIIPKPQFINLIISSFKSDTKASVKKGKDKATLIKELEENKPFNKLITETLGMDISIFHEIIRQETE